MGDVVSFVEKAQEVVDQDEAMRMQEKLAKNELTLEDFLSQIQMMKKLGPIGICWMRFPGCT